MQNSRIKDFSICSELNGVTNLVDCLADILVSGSNDTNPDEEVVVEKLWKVNRTIYTIDIRWLCRLKQQESFS